MGDEKEPKGRTSNQEKPEESEEDGEEEKSDQESGSEDENVSEGEGSKQEEGTELQTQYKRLKFKAIKDLHSAVKNYGHNAPFTLAILEGLAADGYLLPGVWVRVVQSVLGRGEFLSWKAEFLDRGDYLAAHNRSCPSTGH